MIIFPWTPPDVIAATSRAWQRRKELAFLARVSKAISRADARGMDRKKMARVFLVASQGLTGKGGTGGVGS